MPLLFETFLQATRTTTRSLEAKGVMSNPLIESGQQAMLEAARHVDKVLFSQGTMQMLIDKLMHPQETLAELAAKLGEDEIARITAGAQEALTRFRGGWIEFPAPFAGAKAIFAFVPGHYLPTGKDQLQLYLIGERAEILEVLSEPPDQPGLDGATWIYEPLYHRCARCRIEAGRVVCCERCGLLLDVWGHTFAICCIITGQYLAERRYEERAVTTMRRKPRQGSGKVRRVPIKHVFKVIDANELVITHAPTEEQERQAGERRGSWIDETTVYEEIRTRPFTRTYRHPRYIHMRGQSVQFPSGVVRKQPRKPERLGKTITKVKASHYEPT